MSLMVLGCLYKQKTNGYPGSWRICSPSLQYVEDVLAHV